MDGLHYISYTTSNPIVSTYTHRQTDTHTTLASPIVLRTLTHVVLFTMLAQKMSVSAKTTTSVVSVNTTAKRGVSIVRRNSKGGEEGARDFGNTYVK